jgi:hypothetical protein
MIDLSLLPSWREIFLRIGEPEPRRNRARCPIHDGDSRTSLSVDEDRGYHCFVCGSGGDKLDFIKVVLKTDFPGAMRWFGLKPGKPPAPDPIRERRQKIIEGLRHWTKKTERQLRDQYYRRSQSEIVGKALLAIDPEDPEGWELLRFAYTGRPLEEIESMLDLLIGKEEQQLQAYEMMRSQ